MNNFPDEDPKLLNFLRQNRANLPPSSPNLEDRLMSEIDLLPAHSPQITYSWRRYLMGGIAMVITCVVGIVIQQVMNPPEPSLAELHQLDLYLEAHADPDLDTDISPENDSYDSVGS